MIVVMIELFRIFMWILFIRVRLLLKFRLLINSDMVKLILVKYVILIICV